MKITIDIDPGLPEDRGDFHLRELTPEVSRLLAQLQNLDFKLIASKNDKKFQLDLSKITRILASDKKVYALMDDKQDFVLSETLISLESKLPADFLRISHSEIVNATKIASFEFTFAGKFKLTFKNGDFTYSSRSYLKEFKRYFGL